MSASNNLSTNCSGLLLRSSFAILAARTRHLFSVTLRLSNSSDIILRACSEPPPPWVACCAHQVQNFDLSQRSWCRGLCRGFNEQIFGVDEQVRGRRRRHLRSVRPYSDAERIRPNSFSPRSANLPWPSNGWGFFSARESVFLAFQFGVMYLLSFATIITAFASATSLSVFLVMIACHSIWRMFR